MLGAMPDAVKLLASSREADWRKAATAILKSGNPRVAFTPFLRPQAIVDATSVRRATVIVEAMRATLKAPDGGSMLVPPLLSRRLRARRDEAVWAASGKKLIEAIFALLARKGTGCSYTLLPNGCLFVMEGKDDALPDKKGSRRLRTMDVPSGKLVVFDAAAPKGKTREKKSLALPRGRYLVEQLHRNDPWLWMIRFTRDRA